MQRIFKTKDVKYRLEEPSDQAQQGNLSFKERDS